MFCFQNHLPFSVVLDSSETLAAKRDAKVEVIFELPNFFRNLFSFFVSAVWLETGATWALSDQMCGGSCRAGCFAKCMARSRYALVFIVPFFSEAGRKSKKVFLISKLSWKFFLFFFSCGSCGVSDVQWTPEEPGALLLRRCVSLRCTCFIPRTSIKRTSLCPFGECKCSNLLQIRKGYAEKKYNQAIQIYPEKVLKALLRLCLRAIHFFWKKVLPQGRTSGMPGTYIYGEGL